ncbi:MAG: FAD-binding oxidoreductase [Elusimicrobia bacterium]|nr:FAD-binding oxidoreductase [Candidatus Liberimonas magnetica]
MLIKTDKDTIQSYFEDQSGLTGGYAESVYIPENEKEISDFIAEAGKKNTPVTVSGAGTGVTGGRVPFGGVVLSLERLNRIFEIRDSSAVVGAGVTVKELKEAAKERNLMYCPDPTEQNSFIGGNVSTNASGSRGFRYGPTRNYIKRLKIILSNGEFLNIERGKNFAGTSGILNIKLSKNDLTIHLPKYVLPDIKNAAGYFNRPGMDLIDLFIGHEGTLGIITEVEVLLKPLIDKTFSGIIFFPAEEFSWDLVSEAKTSVPGILSLEYFDHNSLELLKNDYPNIPEFAKAAIFFEQHISSGLNENKNLEQWVKLLGKYKAPEDKAWFATSARDQEGFRDFRYSLPEKVNEIVRKNKLPKTGTDIAVPQDRIKEMLLFYKEKLESSKIPHMLFGHIGESHLHSNFLPTTQEDQDRSRKIYLELVERALKLGGTVSAEHGIGKLKHIFLEKMVGSSGMKEMAILKRTLDPACILGLDNIFPKELL